MPNKAYVEEMKGGALRVAGSRVSLDSVVYAWRDGDSPETIRENFPTLTLAQVYGAVAYYLENREAVDEYLRQGEVEYEEQRRQWRAANPEMYRRLGLLKAQKGAPV